MAAGAERTARALDLDAEADHGARPRDEGVIAGHDHAIHVTPRGRRREVGEKQRLRGGGCHADQGTSILLNRATVNTADTTTYTPSAPNCTGSQPFSKPFQHPSALPSV